MDDTWLFGQACQAREKAYAPYSRYTVGAALLAASGRVYLGGNIENAAYTPTVCAERTAFFKAVSEGERRFAALAVAGGPLGEPPAPCAPCGVCRQVMAEFCQGDFQIVIKTQAGICRASLAQLLPERFGPDNLKEKS